MMSFFTIVLWTITIINIAIHEVSLSSVKWNKYIQEFEPIPGLLSRGDKEERAKTAFQSRQEEIHDFNGAPLRIFYFEDPSFFEFYDNDTKAKGICGDIWTILSRFLNFTLVLTKLENNLTHVEQNSNVYKIYESIMTNKSDIIPKAVAYPNKGVATFTPVLWLNRQRIFARAYWTVDKDWIFDVFSVQVWVLILTVILTLSIASIMTQNILIRNKILQLQDRSCFAHLFYTFASICNQGNSSDNATSGSRMLTFIVNIFSWIILTAYSSCLIHNLTQEEIDAPYNDLATLFKNTNLQILVLSGSLGHTSFFRAQVDGIHRRIMEANRVSVEMNIDKLYRKVCLYPNKYVLWDEEDAVATRNLTYCRLFPVDIPRNPIMIASAIRRQLKYRRSLEIGILKLHELGVINRIMYHYMPFKIEEATMRRTHTLFIEMHHVSLIFAIFIFGIFASILICAIENIFNFLKNLKNN